MTTTSDDKTTGPKEAAYDEHIAPLMAQIIALCKEHKINAAAQFVLDYNEAEGTPLRCSTVLPVDEDDAEGFEHIGKLRAIMYPPAPGFAAFTLVALVFAIRALFASGFRMRFDAMNAGQRDRKSVV